MVFGRFGPPYFMLCGVQHVHADCTRKPVDVLVRVLVRMECNRCTNPAFGPVYLLYGSALHYKTYGCVQNWYKCGNFLDHKSCKTSTATDTVVQTGVK